MFKPPPMVEFLPYLDSILSGRQTKKRGLHVLRRIFRKFFVPTQAFTISLLLRIELTRLVGKENRDKGKRKGRREGGIYESGREEGIYLGEGRRNIIGGWERRRNITLGWREGGILYKGGIEGGIYAYTRVGGRRNIIQGWREGGILY